MIVGISGKAESGKTTSMMLLKEIIEETGDKVLIINYGDFVKFIAEKYLNWNGEKDTAGRKLLQELGTEKGRMLVGNNIWVDSVINTIKMLKNDFDHFLIGDCRFPNEYERFKDFDLNITSLNIVRSNHVSILTDEQKTHSSETSLDNYVCDFIINNDNTLEDLKNRLRIFWGNTIIKHFSRKE